MPEDAVLWGSLGFLAGVLVALVIGASEEPDPGVAIPVPRSTVVECQPL
jgi:hypothetical protein